MIRFVITAFLLLCVGVPMFVGAQDFTVRQLIGTDTVPPTTPGPLTAEVISTDQIDLSWGASTDDFSFGGYQVFRDSAQIATTTLTTYSDTGLTASTTYSYFVVAFDSAFNFSSSSNIVTTTTLDIFVPPPTPTSTDSSDGPQVSRPDALTLSSLDVVPAHVSAFLTWKTNRYARYTLRWGTTEAYELGFMTNQVYQKDHQTLIADLDSNTAYEYELIGYDRGGQKIVLSRSQFKTLALPDVTPPPNVSVFKAEADSNDVLLTWKNPDFDFAHVRIVRNPHFYPTDPNNGFVVYQGTDEQFTDSNAFSTQDHLYYTAFVYDPSGNRSSGATTFVQQIDSQGISKPPIQPSATTTHTDLLTISLEDVVIIQGDEIIRSVDDSYLVDTNLPFTMSAPYELFPEHLKAIQLTLYHPVDETISYSYLLRINSDKSAYEATISRLGFFGTIPLKLAVYDFETEQTAVAEGTIVSKEREPTKVVIENITPWFLKYVWPLLLLLLLCVIFIWWLFLIKRKRDEDKRPLR